MNQDPQNILVIHFGQMGDVVLGLPALAAIRDRFRSSRVTLLIGRSAAAAAEPANIADETIVVDRVNLRDGGKISAIIEMYRLAMDIRRRKFDLVIDLHSLAETNLLGFVAGIPKRLYANRENRSINWLSNHEPRPPAENKLLRLPQRYLDALAPLGVTVPTPLSFRYAPTDEEIDEVRNALQDHIDLHRPLVAIFPGAGHASRRWPLDRYAELAVRLNRDGIQTMIDLGPEEASRRDEIAAKFPVETLITEGFSIRQLIALFTLVTVFVGNDSGPAHLAACSGATVVLVSDERSPDTFLPLTEDMVLVNTATIDRIETDDVYRVVERIVSTGRI